VASFLVTKNERGRIMLSKSTEKSMNDHESLAKIWSEIIDEQYQDVLSENCSDEKRRKKLAFLEALREFIAARTA
jgi:hypothetical protein